MYRKKFVLVVICFLSCIPLISQNAPKPIAPVPNERQLEWYDREIIAFFHFGINTFEDFVNEGDGRASTSIFNPTHLDCRQWASTMKNAGISGGILVAKHADGFCNWPSAYTDYCVKNSPWHNGKGDLVREFVDAFNEAGLKPGLYLGPHDRHEHLSPIYSIERYRDYYANQLTELMTNYGTIWETWWDGAGADELTTPVYTKWAEIVRRHQPHCVIFGTKNSYRFADVRWVGNEAGIAGDPCWSTIDSLSIRDEWQHIKELNEGEVNGNAYIPAETDVSIRPSWFYHPEEDDQVKSVKELWDIYCKSVGRNSVLLLNLPPDRRGLLHPKDSLHVVTLRKAIDETFENNLLKGAKISSLYPRGGSYKATNLIDNLPATYYASKDDTMKDEITFTLNRLITFDCLMICEVTQLGHRTTGWSVEYSLDGKEWTPIPEATNKQSIGNKWIERFTPVTARKVRLKITDGKSCPAIHSFGVYKQSPLVGN